MSLQRADFAELIPHAAGMALIDRVERWDGTQIHCSAELSSERRCVLRGPDGLSSVHLCEFGAQATAVHGGLLARERGERAPPGFLVALREVRLECDFAPETCTLSIRAEQLQSGGGSWQYRFEVSVEDRVLASGRVAVIAQP